MREIKFRGLRTDGNGWVHGVPFFIKGERKCFIITNCQSLNLTQEDSAFDGYEVIPETVGQFTGLKDKNGTEIYDGDLIKYDGIEGIVSFDDSMFQVRFEYTRSVHALGNLDREIEVIGNIHTTHDKGKEESC